MRVFMGRASRIVLVVAACVALAVAGDAPSDYHVTRPAKALMVIGS